ncbi:sugar translocase [Paenibacillus glycanilyticus]|uniref:lipopolysaccharide biosynthesis protein n=1 Tax=Paenibacillus glycanilyticus TaxID=126569 RepID=UPI00203F2AC0|nr:sugar translocase [Paenibacillus glycanilyticus]MCM3630344.1 sugar translocase [Paenibacillus glycanilyticus]
MNADNRTKNTVRNSLFGVTGQIINILLNFINRTVFISVLGTEYLGVSGLFTNILTVLSLAELGFGTAIIYSLYKPLVEKDEMKISALVGFYSRIYLALGLCITFFGLCLLPFLDLFIKGNISIPNIEIIFSLFLINTVITYFLGYKRTLLIADQKSYINSKNQYYFTIIRNILQVSILFITNSFIIYLTIQIFSTFFENYFISRKVDKEYPFLKKENKVKLDTDSRKGLFKNIRALMLYKFAGVAIEGTDNLIISSFIGVFWVGIVSNYTLIIMSLTNVLTQLTNSITASIGNLIVKEDTEKQAEMFNVLTFMYIWLFGFCSLCLFILLNPFIKLWIGHEYLLSWQLVLVLVVNFFVVGIMGPSWIYRETKGLFIFGKYRPVITAIINLVLSLILVNYIGLIGTFLATLISRVLTNFWFDPLIVYKHGFNKSVGDYYKKVVINLLLLFLLSIMVWKVTSYIPSDDWWSFALLCFAATFLFNLGMIIVFFRTKEFKYLLTKTRGVILSRTISETM